MKIIVRGRKTSYIETSLFEVDNIARVMDITLPNGNVVSYDIDPEPVEVLAGYYLSGKTNCIILTVIDDVVTEVKIYND